MRLVSPRLTFLATLALLSASVGVRTEAQTTSKAKMDAKAKGAGAAVAQEKVKKAAETPTAPVNLNTASLDELQTLPGIGPVYAKEIVAGRPYQSVDELAKVKGLGKAKIDGLRNRVTTAMPAPAAATVTPTPSTPGASRPATRPSAKGSKPAGSLVNINTATKDELDILPGIGPVKAQAIIDHRPFTKAEDIMKVPGIKQGEFSRIKEMISVK